jgi:hypothetical protein
MTDQAIFRIIYRGQSSQGRFIVNPFLIGLSVGKSRISMKLFQRGFRYKEF